MRDPSFFSKSMKSAKANRLLVLTLFILYLYVLLKVILFKFGSVDILFLWQQLQSAFEDPAYIQNRLDLANFVPFRSITQNIHGLHNPHDLINLIGNIAIFIPNGILISILVKKKCIWVFISSFVLSLGLECSQVVFSMGSFDVDDLILNVSGGILGYCALQVINLASWRKSADR